MNIQKNKVLMKELIWMFDSRNLNKKINKLHERCLRIIYSDITSSFEELLETDIQVSATELHKIVNGLSKGTVKEVSPFNENTTYNTRRKRKFRGLQNRLLFALKRNPISQNKSWELLPDEIKNVESVACFVRSIKLSLSPMPDACLTGWFCVI